MSNLQREAMAAGNYRRVQNTTSEVEVAEGLSVLHRIVATNANAAAQTITVSDGPASVAAKILGVFEIPADDVRTLHFGLRLVTGISITPGSTDIDALVVFDARLLSTSGSGADLPIDVEDAITLAEEITIPRLFDLTIDVVSALTLAEPIDNNTRVSITLNPNVVDAVTVGQGLTIPNLFTPVMDVNDAITIDEFVNVAIS